MKAVILAAGLGKRMKPLTDKVPKALVEMNGKPLVCHVLESLEKGGVKEALIVIGYGGEKVKKRLGRKFGSIKLRYVKQAVPMGTAHAVLQAKGRFKGKFLVASADVIFEKGMWKKLWEKKGFGAVVALRNEKKPERFGVALVKGKKLLQIVEKPKKRLGNLVNAGAYCFSQTIFKELEKTKASSRGEFELTDTVNALASKEKAGFVLYKGKCLDIGTLEELKKAEKALVSETLQ